ncbi:hypothetical protein P5G51_016580 [Virgibacillus sp. 179-BFC.A HS]|uniref:Uncharacterized protein n=1 Tax=Tigheibacillus jepli TaxID=3035914 RepID=A0ABU5CK91_9BACI|nr:hypothetical protein [Virgibacillus sp. 179-BFC.A HS]MDY0406758.1 hypothetical protein [Virgibacillus sp. 179-BFC.A HS]
MKINESIKDFNKLPVFVNQHLSFLDTDNIKFIVAAFTFILLDLGTFPLLYPKIPIIYYIAIPLLVFIHLWALRILIKNPFSTQFESLIYIGVLGVVGTICYFMLVQKTAYMNLGIRNLFYYVISTVLYLFIIGILAYYQIQRYSNINKITVQSPQRERAKKARPNMDLLSQYFQRLVIS